jgi:putative DNA primase/helicase
MVLKIVGIGSLIRTYRKIFKHKKQKKILMRINHVDSLYDDSGYRIRCMDRRLIIVPFNKRFVGSKADRKLSEKLLLELDGIFLWALQGLERLYKNDCFTEAKKVKEFLNEYKLSNNPVEHFVDYECILDSKASTTNDDLYHAFTTFSAQDGYPLLSKIEFFRKLYASYPYLKKVRLGSRNKRDYCVQGIGLIEPFE